jgi:hypothetical protein
MKHHVIPTRTRKISGQIGLEQIDPAEMIDERRKTLALLDYAQGQLSIWQVEVSRLECHLARIDDFERTRRRAS